MTKERYVSFDTAKLLKEKGFDEPCKTYYQDERFVDDVCTKYYQWNSKSPFEQISAPTHQMAMEWLRNTYHIHIVIQPISGKGYNGIMCDVSNFDDFNYISETDFFLHPEEAVEAALKHTLENLI